MSPKRLADNSAPFGMFKKMFADKSIAFRVFKKMFADKYIAFGVFKKMFADKSDAFGMSLNRILGFCKLSETSFCSGSLPLERLL